MILQRSCTEVVSGNTNQLQGQEPISLETFRDVPAYVLLGDPGAGKTTAFKAECKALGEKACRLTADDFLTYKESNLPSEWQEKTLFIDGLDEVRVSAHGASEFREIRKLLRTLGRPRFRLSCREADWLGATDQERLESMSPDSKVRVLRLNPLTVADVETILSARSDVPDSRAFITTAQEKGVDGLLFNPLSLKMLADAVAGGQNWPESRGQTFEEACRRIVCEHDPVPRMAAVSSSPPTPEQLLDAAGRLCAVQLITGKAGYTLHGLPANDEYPALDRCEYDYPNRLRLVINSKLFRGEGVADNRFTPVHRHIAEFLGARYLARIIGARRNPLPARRVIALLTGRDGAVVTEMRGLSAWLAALSPDARSVLIERDPIGVGLYGDIQEFLPREKRALLDSLKRAASRLDSVWKHAAFGPLATCDMQPALEQVLEDSNRDQDHQALTAFVLRVLEQGPPLPGLSRILFQNVRDETRWPGINRAALDAFIHNCPEGQDKSEKLRALLVDVHRGSVSDPDNELAGILLNHLYPQEIPPQEVWNYLAETRDREHAYLGTYHGFWERDLLAKSSDRQVAELLDCLPRRHPGFRSHLLEKLPLKLLIKGLKTYGDQLAAARLYDWLGVGEIEDGYWMHDGIALEIRSWLEERPELQKQLVLEGLNRCFTTGEKECLYDAIYERFFGADLPDGYDFWCLEQSVGRVNTQQETAVQLFKEAFYRRKKDGLTLDVLRQHVRQHGILEATLDQLIAARSRIEAEEQERLERTRAFTDERRRKEKEWLNYVRANEVALRENNAAPGLLYRVAQVYFESPKAALKEDRIHLISAELRRSELERLRRDGAGLTAVAALLGGDRQLIDAAVRGLLGTVDRKDVPDVREILDLWAESQMHYLGWPYLAALEETERTASEDSPPRWNDGQLRRALAFYFCYPPTDIHPEWYGHLLRARPEIVADVQVQFTIVEFRRGREHFFKLTNLAEDPAYAQVASHAALPLLRAFPTRCKLGQLDSLEDLLWAAIQHADRSTLRELIERKLSRTSMNDTQRALWLAAGFAIEPGAFQPLLTHFFDGHERRSRYLAEFFRRRGRRFPLTWLGDLGISASAQLIHILGSYVGPEVGNAQGLITPSMRASRLVHGLIQQNLATSPDKAANSALARLLEDPGLYHWRDVLSQAQDEQRVIRCDAEFQHPSIERVCQTLNGGAPANAGDLAALVVDQLQEFADVIQKGDTNAWRQFWNVDPYDRPDNRRPENSCRNTLLTALQQRLQPRGIDARGEVQHANDKRTDICVSYDGFQVPLEIKRNDHRDLWSALRNQLITQYTSHPGADGYGIYLVFWFGKEYTQPPPSGKRPATVTELQERLKKEAKLSEAEERKISVHVIDVSKP